MSQTAMLDTNIFNHVLDGKFEVDNLKEYRLVATHIQRDEIQNTKDQTRREKLLTIFEELIGNQVPTSSAVADISVADGAGASSGGVVPTESAVWGISRWGEAKWSRDDDIFTAMRQDLDALNKRKNNNAQDILIAETALRQGWLLMTTDANLAEIVTKYGGACRNPLTDVQNVGAS